MVGRMLVKVHKTLVQSPTLQELGVVTHACGPRHLLKTLKLTFLVHWVTLTGTYKKREINSCQA